MTWTDLRLQFTVHEVLDHNHQRLSMLAGAYIARWLKFVGATFYVISSFHSQTSRGVGILDAALKALDRRVSIGSWEKGMDWVLLDLWHGRWRRRRRRQMFMLLLIVQCQTPGPAIVASCPLLTLSGKRRRKLILHQRHRIITNQFHRI